MEEAIIRHYPAILEDREYLAKRPIGMAYEKAEGYEIILRSAGFREIEVVKENKIFISTDEEEWWRQMQHIGWDPIIQRIERNEPGLLLMIKEAIFKDLQSYKKTDGIHFDKQIFFVCGVK